MIAGRKKIAGEYFKALKGTGVGLPVVRPGTAPSFYRFVIKVKDPVTVMASMKKKGIDAARPLFRPLHYYLGLTGYPVADRLQRESVSLPIYPSLTRGEMNRIKEGIKKSLKMEGS
ncbi:MAG: hypothetical protein A2293_04960 [Elusimicrobia bacterium RIFOXYB2_FULL_49_7]|nr:MAG: hypothetical protein A2293_04960 [Elusimicrobia bacterium RIFOXYB2_FULL_49_7]